MKSILAALVFAFPLLVNAGMPTEIIIWSTPTVRGTVTTTGSEIHYTGDIDAAVAKTIVNLIEQQKYDTLQIQSEEGDAESARLIGASVFDHQMTVVVNGPCASSCAKYIFTAAKRKNVKPGGFVMFSEHEGRRNLVRFILKLVEKRQSHGVAALSVDEEKFIAAEKWVEVENNYFAKIGVDRGITTFFYTPDRPAIYWLLTAKRMAEFGVSNVILPNDYASEEDCERMKIAGLLRWDAQCLQ